jgi:UDP-2,4-diacetamido-2,4,6-trideoxy-beta-L-altropyranose hydrolase
MTSSLVLRVDASTEIGIGHFMRCLALAQGWMDAGGSAIFLMSKSSPSLEARLRSEGARAVHLRVTAGSANDAAQTADIASNIRASWVVVDGYHFGSEYQKDVKARGLKLLFLDDNGHTDYYCADLVLNQNLHANVGLYKRREPFTQLLLGTNYVLLRREFLRWRGRENTTAEKGKKVLVTLGGSDQENVTSKVIRALQKLEIPGMEVKIVVGGSNPNLSALMSLAQSAAVPIVLEKDVSNMPELMGWADMAVVSGGTTVWEMAFMGVPYAIIAIADNQLSIAEHLGEMGMALNLGWHEKVAEENISLAVERLLKDPARRGEMARLGRQMVDGLGVSRVLKRMKGGRLGFRQATEEDCELLWRWANDSLAREASFSCESIPWEEHVQWFNRKMHDSNCLLLVASDDQGSPLGLLRFEVEGDEAVISVSINKDKRGLGFGAELIMMGVEEMHRWGGLRAVNAFIKPENLRSIRAFEEAGFVRAGIQEVKGQPALHYIRTIKSPSHLS